MTNIAVFCRRRRRRRAESNERTGDEMGAQAAGQLNRFLAHVRIHS